MGLPGVRGIADPRDAPRPLSPTFGPQERFPRLDERLYGSVRADAGRRTLTVDLRDEAGDPVHQVVIPAR